LDHPPIAQAIAVLRARQEADRLAKENARASAAAQRAMQSPAGGGSIDTFNRANRLSDLFAKYGYEPHPNGHDWRSPHQGSRSFATRSFIEPGAREHWVSLSESDAAAGLGAASANGGRFGDAFDLFVHYEHGGNQAGARAAWTNAAVEAEAERRREQREANRKIGAGSNIIPSTEIHTVSEMLGRYVFIREGSLVADVTCPHAVLSLTDFKNATAGSKHKVGTAAGVKMLPASKVWLESADRQEADTLTFHAGAKRMTVAPDANKRALNLWVPTVRPDPPENWEWQAARFVNHVHWLWGDQADAFLDWLAHIEQKPGELPHYGWIHISRIHGKGRNWISSVLSRLWRGNVAASLDLIGVLEDGFSGRLSRCLLAIIDEINEGGNHTYRHAQALRQIVTAEVREINPKYGRRHIEYNAARWLLFSNHAGAIPLGDDDRRFWVVSHEGPARDEAYYTSLYGRLEDLAFIASVAEYLRTRNIAGFNPGQRPAITEAKAELIAVTQSEEEATFKELVARWPVDLITASELWPHLGLDELKRPATRHAMERAGIRKLRKVRTARRSENIYALRNYDQWSNCDADKLRAEIARVADADKEAALDGDD
jgi:hypothetical protein